MAFYLDMASLIDMFGTNITVFEKSDVKSGDWTDGEWHPNGSAAGVELHEPFLPFDIYSNVLAGVLQATEAGETQRDKAYWFSTHKYGRGTIVVYEGVRYRVIGVTDYTGYSNVTQYELETEVQNNGNIQ